MREQLHRHSVLLQNRREIVAILKRRTEIPADRVGITPGDFPSQETRIQDREHLQEGFRPAQGETLDPENHRP